jgi:hypothetical protein
MHVLFHRNRFGALDGKKSWLRFSLRVCATVRSPTICFCESLLHRPTLSARPDSKPKRYSSPGDVTSTDGHSECPDGPHHNDRVGAP